MATGPEGRGNAALGLRYREILKRSGIHLRSSQPRADSRTSGVSVALGGKRCRPPPGVTTTGLARTPHTRAALALRAPSESRTRDCRTRGQRDPCRIPEAASTQRYPGRGLDPAPLHLTRPARHCSRATLCSPSCTSILRLYRTAGTERPSPKIRAEWRLCNGSAWRRQCLTWMPAESVRSGECRQSGSYFYAGSATPSSCCRPFDSVYRVLRHISSSAILIS